MSLSRRVPSFSLLLVVAMGAVGSWPPAATAQDSGGTQPAHSPPGQISQMTGQPLFVTDLPVGTVTVRVVRDTLDAIVPNHRVELQGPGKMVVATTDAEGRARFDALPPGTMTQAFTTLDGRQLMSMAFPVPADGGTRLLLVSSEPGSAQASSALPLLTTAVEGTTSATSPLAQMAGLPLQVVDLPPGVVSVRLLRGGFDHPVVGHEVELHLVAGQAPIRAETDDEGRATFPATPAGAVVHAVAIVDGEVLESQAFPLPERGGVRLILVAGVVPAGPVPSSTSAQAATVAGQWPVAQTTSSAFLGHQEWSLTRMAIAAACFGAACAIMVMTRYRNRLPARRPPSSPV